MSPDEREWPTVEIRVENTWERPKPAVKHGARFEVSLDRLADVLGLPEGARVLNVAGDLGQQLLGRAVTVMVEHPDLPEVCEGGRPVDIVPAFEWCDMEGKEILTDWGL